MPVYTKIEDSIKDSIRQHMDRNPDGAWEDHYNFIAWAYVGEHLTNDPIIDQMSAHYENLMNDLCKAYGGVEKADLICQVGEVIADNEYSYLKAWGAIEVYDTVPDYPNWPDC